MDYDLHSQFDIDKHKQHFINYCEVVILPSGEIQYAAPSHIEKLIKITEKSRNEIYEQCPADAQLMDWLIEQTNCISVWSEFYMGKPKTKEQEYSLQRLIDNGLTKGRVNAFLQFI